jgi:ubiquitin-activating enzyme E1
LVKNCCSLEKGNRYDGLRIILGKPIFDKHSNNNLFMVGAGAIGCKLLKIYAILGIG